MLRFISKICSETIRKTSPRSLHLLALEIKNAEFLCIRFTQELYFLQEYQDLSHHRSLHPRTSILKFCLFMDEFRNCIRMEGRLKHVNLSEIEKHPFILPKDSHLTLIIVKQHHHRALHSGAQLTFSLLRSKFWIILKCWR